MRGNEADAMNLRAYSALDGASPDWRTDLATLLRSDVPLNRMLRNRLIALIENLTDEGPRLELKGHKAARDQFLGVVIRHDWMEIGRWVAAYPQSAASEPNATQAAADHFGLGTKKVEAALTYFNKVRLWTDRAMESDAGKAMGREWVERLYHSITVNPGLKQVNKELLQQLGLSH
ncbi:MAG: hypothetical protein OSB00_06560 [Sphingomonas bacterium]|nr:hypothetical protein [Sphingomonas bacterium]